MKRFFLFALIATVFAACSTDATQELAPEIPTSPDELYVAFDEEESRVQLGENGAPVWTEGDLVSVFYRSNSNDKYRFDGKTGDTDGTLTRISSSVASVGLEKIVAVYPYSEDYLVSLLSGDIIAFLPETQYYEPDSYGIGSSIMISASKNSKLSFRNVCGWLKLQFTGSGSIRRIVLRGNDGEQVAGHIYIHPDDASCTLASEIYENSNEPGDLNGALNTNDTALTSVTLDCGDGVALNSETPTAFYIALPPHKFARGINITVMCDNGTVRTKSTEKSITVKRNHIEPMASLAVEQLEITEAPEIPNTPAQPTPPANEIWYTSSDGKIVYPYDTSAFGAPIISSTYKDGKGVIKFNGNITSIGYEAFYKCSALTSINIPNSVTEIGNNAFYNCEALTSVNIPNSVTEIGDYTFYDCALKSITIPNSVTEIGYKAFYDCSALTSVTIGNSVTSIGEGAFYHCSALKSITIPDSVTEIEKGAFYGCYALTSVTIPNSVTEIGVYAFSDCSALTRVDITDLEAWCKISFSDSSANPLYYAGNLYLNGELLENVVIPESITELKPYVFCGANIKSVTIHNSVTSIGDNAFYYCKALKSITIPNSVTSIGGSAFQNCYALTSVTIPDSVTSIGSSAFSNCAALESVNIGNSVTEIGDSAFYSCSALKSATIGNSVTSIGDSAFRDCSALESATIGNSVTTIGGYAFYYCEALKSVNIGNSVTTIGTAAFAGCFALKRVDITDLEAWCKISFSYSANPLDYAGGDIYLNGELLENVVIPESITKLKDYVFYNAGCIKSVTIPDSITTIGNYAFHLCSSLTSVTIPNSVTSIGKEAFRSCYALTSVTIPNSVTEIGEWAFAYCTALTSITIPNSVTKIGERAFAWCYALKEVYCKPTTPPTGGGDMFSNNASGRRIFVPTQSVSSYKAKWPWSDYASAIEPYEFTE